MICRKCGIDKPEDLFRKGRRVCIDCIKLFKREAYQKDLERQRALSRERNRRYREGSYDKFKSTQDRWKRNNPERRKDIVRDSYYKDFKVTEETNRPGYKTIKE